VSDVLPPFQRFLDDHRAEVWRLLRASVGPDQADDCFQETFIAALRAYPRLRPDSDLRAWVLTIAHRKALDVHRAHAHARAAVPMAQTAHAATGARDGAGARIDVASGRSWNSDDSPAPALERDERLWSAVRELPERQRSAVVLRCLGDLPHRDIAAAIGCSEQAARRSLHDGLTRLRETIARV
jgi:RNA polymerase sigma factor (sigma-70 family)